MTDIKLLILNGPGLAELSVGGDRYGNISLEQIEAKCAALCNDLGLQLDFRQTDEPNEMFRWIAEECDGFDALIINPVGYLEPDTVDVELYHSTNELIGQLKKPVIEVHLTNVFRQGGELAKPLQGPEGEMGFVCGLGIHGYLLGIKAVAKRLQG